MPDRTLLNHLNHLNHLYHHPACRGIEELHGLATKEETEWLGVLAPPLEVPSVLSLRLGYPGLKRCYFSLLLCYPCVPYWISGADLGGIFRGG